MRVAIIASPFIPVPPVRYGGTELFVANLAEALEAKGVETVVYSNGASTVKAENRWRYLEPDWPPASELGCLTKELDHISWSLEDAADHCDILHINSALAVTYSRFVQRPVICTMHHPHEVALTDIYQRNRQVTYAAISRDQASRHTTLNPHVIPHGIDLTKYRLQTRKDGYLCFLGRIAPIKGTHIAIEVAKKAGIPLKIAGEIQPIFRDYYDAMVKPHVDGRFIEYVGEADLEAKNQLLGGSLGMLFPIQWAEPFGLVMVEAMACGTPVFAFNGGAVQEVICPGVSGSICTYPDEMAACVQNMVFKPAAVRNWVTKMFSAEVMAERYLDLYRIALSRKIEKQKAGEVGIELNGELASPEAEAAA